MSYATATVPGVAIDFRRIIVPGPAWATGVRRAMFVVGSVTFAVAIWAVMVAIMLLG